MATAWWETAHTVEPVKEAYWVKNAEAWRKKNLRYYPWYGRGYVQLTWERNYIHAGKQLGLDLTTNPESVMVPDVSAKILVTGSLEGWFTGKKLGDYITLSKSDFKGARRIINGTDKAAAIAKIATAYDAALRDSGYGIMILTPDKPVHWLTALLQSLFGGKA
jgi:predicted chitinase